MSVFCCELRGGEVVTHNVFVEFNTLSRGKNVSIKFKSGLSQGILQVCVLRIVSWLVSSELLFQMEKLRPKEVKGLTRSHDCWAGLGWGLNPGAVWKCFHVY